VPRLVLAALIIISGVVLINAGRANPVQRSVERLELSPARGED